MSARLRVLGLGVVVALAATALAAAATTPSPPPAHNLVAIEFVESPPTGLVVSGGLLGVPDSTGRFPERYQRFDPVTNQQAGPGRAVGDMLVFTDLGPGTYRLAMVFLTESKLATRLLPKNHERLEDHCPVYSDSIAALTFTVGEGDLLYLGRLARRTRPSLDDKGQLWQSWLEWSGGDTRKALRDIVKRKTLAPWRDLASARLALLDSTGADRAPRR